MSNFSAILGSLGYSTDAASTSGSAHAKLAQLVAWLPTPFLFNGTTSAGVVRPNSADAIIVTAGAGVLVLGAWTQIVAPSDLSGHMLVAFCASPGQQHNNLGIFFEFGVGGAGAEVVFARSMRYDFGATAVSWNCPSAIYMPPGYQVPANARVSCRVAAPTASDTFYVFLNFVPRPLA